MTVFVFFMNYFLRITCFRLRVVVCDVHWYYFGKRLSSRKVEKDVLIPLQLALDFNEVAFFREQSLHSNNSYLYSYKIISHHSFLKINSYILSVKYRKLVALHQSDNLATRGICIQITFLAEMGLLEVAFLWKVVLFLKNYRIFPFKTVTCFLSN